MRALPVTLLALLIALTGCGGLLGGGSSLSVLEVAGRYRFVEYTLDPVSGAVDDIDLRDDVLPDDVTLLLREDGTVSLQRLRGEQVDETLAQGSFTVSGDRVTVRFRSGDVGDYYMPAEIAFEGGDGRLEAEILREGLNLERISSDYRGITRADARLVIRLREIG